MSVPEPIHALGISDASRYLVRAGHRCQGRVALVLHVAGAVVTVVAGVTAIPTLHRRARQSC